MSGKLISVRAIAAAAGIGLLGLAAAHAQTELDSPPINQTPAPGEMLTPTQPQLQELPSVADLADRLLPAVVEITIEPAAAVPMPRPPAPGDDQQGQPTPDDPSNPFKDFFDEFLKKGPGGQTQQTHDLHGLRLRHRPLGRHRHQQPRGRRCGVDRSPFP